MRRAGRHSAGRSAALAGGLIVAVLAAALARTTAIDDPPRFDGAGYAVLARALATGRGYREIDRPDAPRHAHFPPGYPLTLALAWRLTGRVGSAGVAHGLSLGCTLLAALATYRWFRTQQPLGVAALLGLALAVNWTWTRTGGAIQSEPLFLLLGALALLAAVRVGRRGGVVRAAGLGAALAAVVLTRHVGVALAAAVLVDLGLRSRSKEAAAAAVVLGLGLLPWVAWVVSAREPSQAALLTRDNGVQRVAWQAWFYAGRIPDALSGPFVEVATVFRPSGPARVAAGAFAVAATAVVLLGWTRGGACPRRRLAALVGGLSLALLLVWPFTEAGRFLIPLVPCLLLGATEGLTALARRLGVDRRRARRWAAAFLLLGALPYSLYALASDRAGALRRTHAGFDAACDWLAHRAERPGPVLTRHPGEVFGQTGRHALAPATDAPDAVAVAITRFDVAYLLVDDERYANAPPSPLAAYVARSPASLVEVWRRDDGRSTVVIYEVRPPARRSAAGRNPRAGGSSPGSTAPSS